MKAEGYFLALYSRSGELLNVLQEEGRFSTLDEAEQVVDQFSKDYPRTMADASYRWYLIKKGEPPDMFTGRESFPDDAKAGEFISRAERARKWQRWRRRRKV